MNKVDKDLIDYFIKHTDDRFDLVDERFRILDDKLDDMRSFKLKIIGGAMVIGAIFGTLMEAVILYFR